MTNTLQHMGAKSNPNETKEEAVPYSPKCKKNIQNRRETLLVTTLIQ
jgi:hypothetical protein